jgi:uncharacterized protein
MKISVTVKPNSKKGPLVEQDQAGGLLLYVREQAIEGKANKAVIELLAEYYDVPKSLIEVVSGQGSKHKIVKIESI